MTHKFLTIADMINWINRHITEGSLSYMVIYDLDHGMISHEDVLNDYETMNLTIQYPLYYNDDIYSFFKTIRSVELKTIEIDKNSVCFNLRGENGIRITVRYTTTHD